MRWLASGLLNPAIGGKSVKPYQPPGLWEINNTSYQADSPAVRCTVAVCM